ncbi:DUF2975 domain-containing protein [Georgenia sp. Z1491]|uniref:DUF2975 domain-containing protein n=1 Tax=Georgenia sp. Z1491 TaxID=3416707 RepID=UPI003CF33B52
MATEFVRLAPDVAFLRVPMLVVWIAVVACVQVALVAVWRLLDLVRSDEIFAGSASRWVDAVIGSVVTATVLVTGVFVYLTVVLGQGSPAIALALLCLVVLGVGVALLIVVMRALLRRATALESDLATVI